MVEGSEEEFFIESEDEEEKKQDQDALKQLVKEDGYEELSASYSESEDSEDGKRDSMNIKTDE